MLKIRAWDRWQGEALYERLRKRVPSGRTKPISLAFIAVATDLDDVSGNFERFAKAVGGGVLARGYLLTILGFVGRHAATTGVVRCTRSQLGPVVLTDRLDAVSTARGEKIYDALVDSKIGVEIRDEDVREISPPSSPEASPEDGPPGSPASGPRPVGAEERRGEERTKNPPLPPAGAGGRRLRPREAARLAEKKRVEKARLEEIEKRRSATAAAAAVAVPPPPALRSKLRELGIRTGG